MFKSVIFSDEFSCLVDVILFIRYFQILLNLPCKSDTGPTYLIYLCSIYGTYINVMYLTLELKSQTGTAKYVP